MPDRHSAPQFIVISSYFAGWTFTSGMWLRNVASANSPAPPAQPVSFVEVQPEKVPIFTEYAAETYAARDSVEIRAQVDGYLRKRLFNTGDDVKAGDVLYVLDLRPYEADVAKAQGDVAQGEANVELAQRQVLLLQAEADLAQCGGQ